MQLNSQADLSLISPVRPGPDDPSDQRLDANRCILGCVLAGAWNSGRLTADTGNSK
jgi:hypothetical protein